MRITHVISDSGIGGAGRYLLALLPGARLQGWRLTVHVPRGPLAEALADSGFARVKFLEEGEKSVSWGLWRQLRRELEPTDIVHTHASLAARLVARQRGYPLVLTRHTIGPELGDRRLPRLRRGLHRFVAENFTDAIIAVSEACRQRLLAEGVPGPSVRLIYHGIDAQPFLQARGEEWRRQLHLSTDRPVIITVARLTPVKGLAHALQAAAALRDEGMPFTWLFLGQGPQAELLKVRAKDLGLGDDRVRWLGFQEDVAGLLAAADLFVLPSLQEALGLAVLEAMAAGLPVVASQVGGIPEIIRQGQEGFLTAPAKGAALAANIKPLLRNPALRVRMGEAGRQRVLDQFQRNRMWQETDALYRDIVAGRRCRT